MISEVEVHLPLRTHSQAHGKRCHWAIAARERKQLRHAAGLLLRQQRPAAIPCVVTLIRISPGELDCDNLRTALKQIRDEVAIWLGLPKTRRGQADDRDPRVAWRYQQGRGDRHKIIVRVESAPQAAISELRAEEEYRP